MTPETTGLLVTHGSVAAAAVFAWHLAAKWLPVLLAARGGSPAPAGPAPQVPGGPADLFKQRLHEQVDAVVNGIIDGIVDQMVGKILPQVTLTAGKQPGIVLDHAPEGPK